jgi:hypothetical protein
VRNFLRSTDATSSTQQHSTTTHNTATHTDNLIDITARPHTERRVGTRREESSSCKERTGRGGRERLVETRDGRDARKFATQTR